MQVEIFMAVENTLEHKYQRDSLTTHSFQMNDLQRKRMGEGALSCIFHVFFFLHVVEKLTVGKQQLIQYRDFAANMPLGFWVHLKAFFPPLRHRMSNSLPFSS